MCMNIETQYRASRSDYRLTEEGVAKAEELRGA